MRLGACVHLSSVPARLLHANPSFPNPKQVNDFGCDNQCFSGKTWDVCAVCGGNGGSCVMTKPSAAPPLSRRLAAALLLLAALICAVAALQERHLVSS